MKRSIKASEKVRIQSINASFEANRKLGTPPSLTGSERVRWENHLRSPYWGIKDSRGWVSRYLDSPDKNLPTPAWCQGYVLSGGSFDIHGVWGLTPYGGRLLEEAGVPSSFAGRMASYAGQCPGSEALTELYESGLDPSDGGELSRAVIGLESVSNAKKFGFETIRTPLSYGWMSRRRWDKEVMKKSTQSQSFWGRDCLNGVEADHAKGAYKEDPDSLSPMFRKWVEDLLKWDKRVSQTPVWKPRNGVRVVTLIDIRRNYCFRGAKEYLESKGDLSLSQYSYWEEVPGKVLSKPRAVKDLKREIREFLRP